VVPIPIAISLARYVSLRTLSEDSTMADPSEELLARNMVDVHGAEAATIVRANARGAAVAGQPVQARSWIKVLGMIQCHPLPHPRKAGSPDRRHLPQDGGSALLTKGQARSDGTPVTLEDDDLRRV
jgi:hypothetical protein